MTFQYLRRDGADSPPSAAGAASAPVVGLPAEHATFLRRTMTVTALAIGAVLSLLLLWFASGVFLLLFAGLLLAVVLRVPTDWLARHTPLPERLAFGLTAAGLAAAGALLVWLFAVPVGDQLAQLSETLPRAVDRLREWTEQQAWSRAAGGMLSDAQRAQIDADLLGRASGVISSTVNLVVGFVVVLFIGFYLAFQPRLYLDGLLHLVPRDSRSGIRDILDRIGMTLKWWLMGRLITMLLVGSAAGIGLWLLNIPLPFALGLLTALLEFIPYLGPLLAAVPPLLIAFNVEPTLALHVLALYVGIQSVENYLLSPLVEQRTIRLPPALVVFSTVLMGVLFGALGVALASPLTAICIVVVERLYVEDQIATGRGSRQTVPPAGTPPPSGNNGSYAEDPVLLKKPS